MALQTISHGFKCRHWNSTTHCVAFATLLAAAAVSLLRAQTSPPAAASDSDIVTLEKFSIEDRITDPAVAIGTDRTRNTISITREALLAAPAGISALKMLESLPGFNVQTSDALGLYEFGNSVSVRAFNYQQIGFILDGVPLGRSDQFGGSPIYRYVDNENLARVTAAQGSGDVSQPSYASLGPIVEYTTMVPSAKPSASASFSAGSNDLKRGYIKLQSGQWDGFSAYGSFTKQTSDQWRGPGTFDRKHGEAKLRYEASSKAWFEFSLAYNDYFDYDSPSITLAQYAGTAGDPFGRAGRYFGYLGYVPDLPEAVAGIKYSDARYNQYYQQAINARTDTLYRLAGQVELAPDLRLNVTGYFDDKDGYGVSPEAYATSLASYNAERLIINGLNAPKGLQYGLSTIHGHREGAVTKLNYLFGHQSFNATVWIERDEYRRTQARYNQEGGNPAGTPLLSELVHLQRNFVSTRNSQQYSLQDVISLVGDRLKLELGAKALNLQYKIAGYRNPADYIALRAPTLYTVWKDAFLPQIGVTFAATESDQFFASYAENLAEPRGADDIFALASPAAPPPKAEKSQNYEFGVRTNRHDVNAAIAMYFTSFHNRLQSFASLVPGSTTTETYFQNVGDVDAHGIEVSGGYRPSFLDKKLGVNVNVSYNESEFQDNFPGVPLAGKVVPDSPKWLLQTSLTYQPVKWAVLNLSAHTLTRRYSNFLNTEAVGGYTTYSLYLDLGGDKLSFGPLKQIKFRLNWDNITDKDYLGTITVSQGSGPATFRPGPNRTLQATVSMGF